ncbi:ABC transporter permease [Methanococcoides seepicolus]|uniref:ABC transporter permease n=1 Tax=Methanococcoides seepicolus TaxID=2828780 RepID=A0A9E4ZJI9_9EURY|nr:ABC transporter permease [Methanococcoides seepicolus]MCM1987854.1 ABC transporter permease [Methanococcoides seepicolus]
MTNKNAVLIIAKKEFSDKLHEPSFLVMMSIFMVTLFVYTLGSSSFSNVARVIGVFFPILAIALGYDGIIKEKNSKSLNVLLTHPLFRDNIITGKFFGISITLGLVVFISLIIIAASDFLISGKIVQFEALSRLMIFGIFTYLYLLTFAVFALFTSTRCKTEIGSLAWGVVIWINMCFVLGPTIIMLSSIITGQSMFEMTDKFFSTGALLFNISPIHHFAEVTVGNLDLSYGTFGIQRDVHGFLDTKYSVSYLIGHYWQNVIILLALPVILLVASYISFLRENI